MSIHLLTFLQGLIFLQTTGQVLRTLCPPLACRASSGMKTVVALRHCCHCNLGKPVTTVKEFLFHFFFLSFGPAKFALDVFFISFFLPVIVCICTSIVEARRFLPNICNATHRAFSLRTIHPCEDSRYLVRRSRRLFFSFSLSSLRTLSKSSYVQLDWFYSVTIAEHTIG